ncbi:iron ABC transporter permease, partial [Methanosalsum natronophilum]
MGLDKKSHHDENDGLNEPYRKYIVGKLLFLTVCTILLILLFLYSISRGPSTVSLIDAVHILFGNSTVNAYNILWNIRIPRALTAIVAGVGLSVAGVALQSILRNPLGSPYTLGISNAAAFGAAFSVIVIGTGSMHSSGTDAVVVNQIYVTTFAAFIGAMIATFILLLIAKYKSATPEVMILVGVALGSLFTAGTMFLQYFADDVQLAAVVFWTFGDVGRASWNDLI